MAEQQEPGISAAEIEKEKILGGDHWAATDQELEDMSMSQYEQWVLHGRHQAKSEPEIPQTTSTPGEKTPEDMSMEEYVAYRRQVDKQRQESQP
jgi:hypothetical protein